MTGPDLPPYRFGIDPGPHPTRHPAGHSFGAAEPDDDATAIARGIELFDHGFFWEAHEALEGPWRRRDPGCPQRALLQAAIQTAAAWLKHGSGAAAPAARLATKAAVHLDAAERGGCRSLASLQLARIRAALALLAAARPDARPRLGA